MGSNSTRRAKSKTAKIPSVSGSSCAYLSHVHVAGNVSLQRKLVVGGNLVVEGNLKAREIYCLGSISVTGNISAENIVVGRTVHAGGSIVATNLVTGESTDKIAKRLGYNEAPIDYIDCLVDESTLHNLGTCESPEADISVKATSLRCDSICSHACIEVDGDFVAENAMFTHLVAGDVYVSESLSACSSVESGQDIYIGKGAQCGTLYSTRNLHADSSLERIESITVRGHAFVDGDTHVGELEVGHWIACTGNITCDRYINAGMQIVANGAITAGQDYGVLAGLAVPRSQWPIKGFISSPSKPKNILTGKYVPGTTAEDLLSEIHPRPSTT